jgi:hypothetical protein
MPQVVFFKSLNFRYFTFVFKKSQSYSFLHFVPPYFLYNSDCPNSQKVPKMNYFGN